MRSCQALRSVLTLLGSPIVPKMTFSMTNGESDVTLSSSLDSITMKRGKLVGTFDCSMSESSVNGSPISNVKAT